MAIDTSNFTPEQEDVFDDIMDELTPGQRNRVLGINVRAAKAVRENSYEAVDALRQQHGHVVDELKLIQRRKRVKMTPLRLLWLPVVFVASMTGLACLFTSIFLCMTIIGLPIGIPMFMGSVVVFWGPWQKWLWDTTGNLWFIATKKA